MVNSLYGLQSKGINITSVEHIRPQVLVTNLD